MVGGLWVLSPCWIRLLVVLGATACVAIAATTTTSAVSAIVEGAFLVLQVRRCGRARSAPAARGSKGGVDWSSNVDGGVGVLRHEKKIRILHERGEVW